MNEGQFILRARTSWLGNDVGKRAFIGTDEATPSQNPGESANYRTTGIGRYSECLSVGDYESVVLMLLKTALTAEATA